MRKELEKFCDLTQFGLHIINICQSQYKKFNFIDFIHRKLRELNGSSSLLVLKSSSLKFLAYNHIYVLP